jgi:hypothetical protein
MFFQTASTLLERIKLQTSLARVMRLKYLNWLAEFNNGTQPVDCECDDNVEMVISDFSHVMIEKPFSMPAQLKDHYNDFAEHKVELAYQVWNAALTYGTIQLDIVDAFFNTIVAATPLGKKFANLRLFYCDIKITVVVQGAPFVAGKLVYAFDPRPTNPDLTAVASSSIAAPQKVRSLLLPHIDIDPSENKVYELILPCSTIWGLYDRTRSFGSYNAYYTVVNPLISGTATAPTVAITTYMSLTNLTMAVPTLSSKSLSSKEQGKYSSFFRQASTVADAVAKVPIPGLPEAATLFSNLSSSAANALAWFGFAKPLVQERTYVALTNTANNLTLVDNKDAAINLALRTTNSLGIDSSSCPLLSKEDQEISVLAAKPGLVAQIAVAPADAAGAAVGSLYVHPATCYLTDAPAIGSGYELTPIAYVTRPFRYWRGTMKVKLEVVASVFHRLTLCVAYYPDATAAVDTFANAVQTLRCWNLQVSGRTEHELEIPWSQPQAFALNKKIGRAWPWTPSFYGLNNVANGFLTFYVVNPLQSNGSTDLVRINVYFSSDDLVIASPTSDFYKAQNLAISLSSETIPTDGTFFSKFFGEAQPTTIKELASRATIARWCPEPGPRAGPGPMKFTMPNAPPLANADTVTNITFQQSLFSYLAVAYVGSRGSFVHNMYCAANDPSLISNGSVVLDTGPAGVSYSAAVLPYTASGFTTFFPKIQNNVSVSVPHYYPGHFRIHYPFYAKDALYLEQFTVNLYGTNSSPTVEINDACRLGDDGQFVFFRGIPVMVQS